jgi:hypothetical protein
VGCGGGFSGGGSSDWGGGWGGGEDTNVMHFNIFKTLNLSHEKYKPVNVLTPRAK